MKNIIYGINNVASKIKFSPHDILKIIICDININRSRIQEIKNLASIKKIPMDKVSFENYVKYLNGAQLGKKILHQNIIAICKKNVVIINEKTFLQTIEKDIENVNTKILILDHIQDPYNLGACIRSSEAMKINFIVLPKNNCAKINNTVIKVSSGSIYSSHINLVVVSNLSRIILKLKKANIWIIGLQNNKNSVNICDLDLTGSIAFIAGSENLGIKSNICKLCDYFGKIPMLGNMDSLNISVAVGIALYEMSRQRKFNICEIKHGRK